MSVANDLCDRVAFIVDGAIKLIDSPRNLRLTYGQPKVRVEVQLKGDSQTQEYSLAGLGANQAFLTLIRQNQVQTIHSQEATLEDVFVEVLVKG